MVTQTGYQLHDRVVRPSQVIVSKATKKGTSCRPTITFAMPASTFELFQSIKDEPKRKCPECGRQKLRRLIGPGAAIVFKGSGFYKTDYRSESYKKAAAAERPTPFRRSRIEGRDQEQGIEEGVMSG